MTCLCAKTRRAARLLTRFYEEALRPAGLTPAQFELLGTLVAHPDLAQRDLSDALALDQTSLSRNLKPLIAKSWIKSAGSSHDRRSTIYRLTPEGRKVWKRAVPLWQNAQSYMQEQLAANWEPTLAAMDRLSHLPWDTEEPNLSRSPKSSA